MLAFMRAQRGDYAVAASLASAGIPQSLLAQPDARITRRQYVALYRSVAALLDDEMLGLWSRPIRGGTLKYLMLSLLDTPTVMVALNRFVRFWNLLLDDYRLHMVRRNEAVRLALIARAPGATANPLGHGLMMKLIHGVASWLLGREIGVHRVAFCFARPRYVQDYVFLFPGGVGFQARETSIYLDERDCAAAFKREKHQLWGFLKRAPEDWTFAAVNRTSLSAKARAFLEPRIDEAVTIRDLADALHSSVRNLTRKFAEEGTGFQTVKDDLRRDIAVHRLTHSNVAVAALALDLGFSNSAVFCRAFRQWTGSSPTAYRKGARDSE
ncbi:AraC family transcriptional regulator [Duganella callida]|uniref:AraC family transcriptional regulator n=2 Tax=Duganella callida TaxID=2561932 RepID=A0A4Y9SEC7_9BURK|nr:AraC family transcriptional regulator [Duganella callida]